MEDKKIPDGFLKFCCDNSDKILKLKELGLFYYSSKAGSACVHWGDGGNFNSLKNLNYANPPRVDKSLDTTV